MTTYTKPNYIYYDEWFDKNIDPMDLNYEKENRFSNSVHEHFYKMSTHNIIIGGSESIKDLDKFYDCKNGFCPLTDEELKHL